MEPTASDTAPREQEAKRGRTGSLENPEVVHEDVPGHVIPILEQEFDDFDTEAKRFLRGDVAENEFIGFRLKQGVYGQRQPDVQMIRVKLPFGGVTPEQLDSFADVVERYAPLRKGHITTRQNIQIHHVPLMDAAEAIRELSDAGLSSREGCGNTVRNVTGDPWAGVCEGELFDITPYVGAYVRYFVRHPTTQLMPRKVKTAFAATDEDRAITGIHDIGFIPRVREVDGRPVRGVELRVGGGTSIMPRIAPTIFEFLELDSGEYLKVCEAVFRVFDRQDWLRRTGPARGSRCSSTRSARRSSAVRSRRSSRATGSPSGTSTRGRCCSSTTRRPTRRLLRSARAAPTATAPSSSASPLLTWSPSARKGLPPSR